MLLEPHPKHVVYDRPSAEQLLAAADAAGWADVLALCIDPANLAATGHDPVASVAGLAWPAGRGARQGPAALAGPGVPPGPGWSRYGPQPPIRFRALGHGGLDWPAIVSALLDEGYSGVLYAEHEDVLLPRQQGIGQTLGVLRGLLPGPAEGRTW